MLTEDAIKHLRWYYADLPNDVLIHNIALYKDDILEAQDEIDRLRDTIKLLDTILDERAG